MQLTAEKLARADKLDRLTFERADGSRSHCPMPRQGTLPHDLVHFVVESALPLRHGFLSQIAGGAEAAFVVQAVHDTSNSTVDTEAVQAEAVVEALQTQLWAGAFDPDAFAEGVRSACAARGQPAFAFDGSTSGDALYTAALALKEQWDAVPFHQALTLEFRAGDA